MLAHRTCCPAFYKHCMANLIIKFALAAIWLGFSGYVGYLQLTGQRLGNLDPAPFLVVAVLLAIWNSLGGYIALQRFRTRTTNATNASNS